MQHVERAQNESDRSESQDEQSKCRQKFTDKIKLHCHHDTQEPPHPLAAAVLGIHLSPVLGPCAEWAVGSGRGRYVCPCPLSLDAGTVLTFRIPCTCTIRQQFFSR